jgi:hypothetical protein
MTNNYSKVKELFTKGELFFDENFLASSNISEEEFSILFPLSKYSTQEFLNDQGSVDCEQIDYIFKDLYEFITHIVTGDRVDFPQEIILIDRGLYPVGEFAQYFKDWMIFFDMLACHQYLDPYKTYVFIEKKTINTSTVLQIKINDFSQLELDELINMMSSPSLLLDSCLVQDAHQGERLATMKASLTSLLTDKKINLFKLLCSAEKLLETYHKNYETYLRSFSFEEFIKDLEDDVSGFINKVEEQIQGFYVQALAVPGAVILSSALRGADKGISLSLIFSAFLAVIIVFTSLNSKTKFINRITENTLKKLNIYQKRTDDIENSSAKEIISEKINDAINSVKNTCMESKQDIFKMRDIIIAMGAMYLIAIVLTGQF